MQIKFSHHLSDLEEIRSFVESHSLPDSSDVKKFLSKLADIQNSSDSIQELSQKEMIEHLSGRLEHLRIRKEVILLAEEAEALANSSPTKNHQDLLIEASSLKGKIDSFVLKYRPSRINAKFLRFAKLCIEKAKKHEPVLVMKSSKNQVSLDHYRKKETSQESYLFAETLYELARLLYQGDEKQFFELLNRECSEEQKKEIHHHVHICGGSFTLLQEEENRMPVIQGILGYAHEISDYFMDNTPYPSFIEIHRIFQDLDFVMHIEKEDE